MSNLAKKRIKLWDLERVYVFNAGCPSDLSFQRTKTGIVIMEFMNIPDEKTFGTIEDVLLALQNTAWGLFDENEQPKFTFVEPYNRHNIVTTKDGMRVNIFYPFVDLNDPDIALHIVKPKLIIPYSKLPFLDLRIYYKPRNSTPEGMLPAKEHKF